MAQTIASKLMLLRDQQYLDSHRDRVEISTTQANTRWSVDSAHDDPAGLTATEVFNSRLRRINIGIRNAHEGMSMIQIADGGLEKVSDLLLEMRDLAVRSFNGEQYSVDREALDTEFSALNDKISRIAESARFNGGLPLLSEGNAVHIQLGSEAGIEDTFSVQPVAVGPLRSNVRSYDASQVSIEKIDAFLQKIVKSRTRFGAMHSKFENAIANLQEGVVKQSGLRARRMDADNATETASRVHSMILMQGSFAVSSQANVSLVNVAKLLG